MPVDAFSRSAMWGRYPFLLPASNQDPLHLVETHLVAPAVVELGGASAGVVGHGRGLFERAAVLGVWGAMEQ